MGEKAPQPDPTSKRLQQAIRESGLSLCEIASRAGMSVAGLSRFLHWHRCVTLTTAHRIATGLGLEWELKPTRKSRRKVRL